MILNLVLIKWTTLMGWTHEKWVDHNYPFSLIWPMDHFWFDLTIIRIWLEWKALDQGSNLRNLRQKSVISFLHNWKGTQKSLSCVCKSIPIRMMTSILGDWIEGSHIKKLLPKANIIFLTYHYCRNSSYRMKLSLDKLGYFN